MHQISLSSSLLETWRGPLANGIDPHRTALIVIDMQVGFIEREHAASGPHTRDIMENVNRLAAALRSAGGRVVYTRHTIVDEAPYALPPYQAADDWYRNALQVFRRDAPGHPIHPGMDVAPTDRIIDKYRYSAFLPISSTLDQELREGGIDTVIITGTLTNACCESSARDAHMMNYEVVFVADATATIKDEWHNATLQNMALLFANVKTTEQTIAQIKSGNVVAN